MNSHAIVYVPTKVGEGFFTDFQSPASGSTDDGKVWSWNNLAGKFIPTALAFDPSGTAAAAVAAHVALSNPHSQYFLASGVSAYGATLASAADAAAARTALALGTAATLNVGTSANNIVQLTAAAKLPAVDGSLLTGITATASPGGSNTQVQYNNAGALAGDAGMTYDASNDRLTVTGGLVAGDWSPPSDSTTAVSIWNAARSTRVVTVDTTNKQLIITSSSTNAQVAPYIGAFNDAARTRYFISYDANFSIARAISPDGNRYLQTQVANGYAQFVTNADLEFVAGGSGNYMQFRPNISGYSMILTDGRLYLRGGSTNTLKFSIQGVSGQTNNLQEWQDSSGGVLASMSAAGAISAGHSNTATAFADLAASTTSRASLRVRAGVAPTSPNDGDFWTTTAGAFLRINGITYSVNLTAV